MDFYSCFTLGPPGPISLFTFPPPHILFAPHFLRKWRELLANFRAPFWNFRVALKSLPFLPSLWPGNVMETSLNLLAGRAKLQQVRASQNWFYMAFPQCHGMGNWNSPGCRWSVLQWEFVCLPGSLMAIIASFWKENMRISGSGYVEKLWCMKNSDLSEGNVKGLCCWKIPLYTAKLC